MSSIQQQAIRSGPVRGRRPLAVDRTGGPPWQYRAYGLIVQSDLPLPEFELNTDPRPPDVTVTWSDDGLPPTNEAATLSIGRDEATLAVPSIGNFSVHDGRLIVAQSRRGVEPTVLRLYVEGMIMATLLYQRGLQVLHASVVRVDGAAVAIMGGSGVGKSSTAAALHARGHDVLADDNAALEYRGGNAWVHPAYPSLKMFPAISSYLGYNECELRPLHQAAQKLGQTVRNAFPSEPVPLHRIYLLSRAGKPSLERLGNMQALIELIRNSVPTRWSHSADALHLQQCSGLVRHLPFYTVRTFSSLSELPCLASLIERHCRQ